MSKKQELIEKYADDLKNKIGENPDMDLLAKVVTGCGPSIYNKDASTVSGSDQTELDRVKNNFLMKKLGLADSPELDKAINAVIEKYGKSERNKYRAYGKSERNKYRAVVYYLLTKHFGKEAIYNK